MLGIHIATPEDSVISKLDGYRKTNETSERQREDVIRLLQLLSDAADMEYLRASAESVDVQDLLERLLSTLRECRSRHSDQSDERHSSATAGLAVCEQEN